MLDASGCYGMMGGSARIRDRRGTDMSSTQRCSPRVDERAFRDTMGRFATGVTVVTTTVGADHHGMTANAFTSVSIDPPLVLVCIDRAAQMHDLVDRAGTFAVTILSADQANLSDHFAESGRVPEGDAQFEGVGWKPSSLFGHPVLTGGLAYLECEVAASYPGGDHSIVVGAVCETEILAGERPLGYFRGAYRAVT